MQRLYTVYPAPYCISGENNSIPFVISIHFRVSPNLVLCPKIHPTLSIIAEYFLQRFVNILLLAYVSCSLQHHILTIQFPWVFLTVNQTELINNINGIDIVIFSNNNANSNVKFTQKEQCKMTQYFRPMFLNILKDMQGRRRFQEQHSFIFLPF